MRSLLVLEHVPFELEKGAAHEVWTVYTEKARAPRVARSRDNAILSNGLYL